MWKRITRRFESLIRGWPPHGSSECTKTLGCAKAYLKYCGSHHTFLKCKNKSLETPPYFENDKKNRVFYANDDCSYHMSTVMMITRLHTTISGNASMSRRLASSVTICPTSVPPRNDVRSYLDRAGEFITLRNSNGIPECHVILKSLFFNHTKPGFTKKHSRYYI